MAYTRYPANSAVNSVTASSPLASSGGSAPDISLSGVVAVANGGTNSSTALNSNRFVVSSGGKIVEASAVTASRALASDANGLPVAVTTTATELGFVNGVTSAIQTQLNAAQPSVNVLVGAYGSRPAPSKAGRLYYQTDGYTVDRDTGSAWASFGLVKPITVPDPTYVWSWVNQGASTIGNINGGLILTMPANQSTIGGRIKALPASPYTITVLMSCTTYNTTAFNTGGGAFLTLRESGSGKGIIIGPSFAGAKWVTQVLRLDASFAFSAIEVAMEIPTRLLWLQIKDDGVNRIYNISEDGQYFQTINSESRTAYITADQIGFTGSTFNAAQTGAVIIYSWSET